MTTTEPKVEPKVEQNDKLSFQQLKNLAQQGDPDAQCQLGVMYNTGNGVKQDFKQAFKWLSKVADLNYAEAQYHLGLIFDNGYGVEQDTLKAVQWYTKAAEQGWANAQINLGFMYIKGQGVKQDYTKALTYFTQAAEQNIAIAQYNLGTMYSNGHGVNKDFEKAIVWYVKAASQGHKGAISSLKYLVEEKDNATASFNLGLLFEQGSGVTQDYSKAMQWYLHAIRHDNVEALSHLKLMATKQNNAEAQYTLAQMYHDGRYVDQDRNKSLKLYTKAANQGHIEAQFTLGDWYEQEATLSSEQGFEYNFEQNCKQDLKQNHYSCSNTQQSKKQSIKVKVDYSKAIDYYTKAAAQENQKALERLQRIAVDQNQGLASFNLGSLYESGLGVEQSFNQATFWYSKASEQGLNKGLSHLKHMAIELGNADAQNVLGDKYYYGIDVEQDKQKAIDYYTKAARHGHKSALFSLNYYAQNSDDALAAFSLGSLYEQGQGVEQDFKQATFWYSQSVKYGFNKALFHLKRMATKKGYAEAQYALAKIYSDGDRKVQDKTKAVYWYIQAAEQGHSKAQECLSALYYQGLDVTQDNYQSVFWLLQMASHQEISPKMQYNLGYLYEQGICVEQSYSKAFEWYIKAAERGHVGALYNVGYMYYQGRGVTQDHKQAFKWYSLAAAQGHGLAQFYLGSLYEQGDGVDRDIDKAFELYFKSAQYGITEAQNKLANLAPSKLENLALKMLFQDDSLAKN